MLYIVVIMIVSLRVLVVAAVAFIAYRHFCSLAAVVVADEDDDDDVAVVVQGGHNRVHSSCQRAEATVARGCGRGRPAPRLASDKPECIPFGCTHPTLGTRHLQVGAQGDSGLAFAPFIGYVPKRKPT